MLRAALFVITLGLLSSEAQASVANSTVVIDPLGRGTWVLGPDRDEVLLVSEKGRVAKKISLPRWPSQIVAKRDGTVFISCRGAGRVVAIDSEFEKREVAVGYEPRALVLSEDEHLLYVG